MRTTAAGALALALVLVAAAPAVAPRPGYVIPPGQLPTDAATARALLLQARSWAPPGTLTRRDITFVLRLADRYLQPSEPGGRQATALRTLAVNAWWYALRAGPIQRSIIRDPEGVLSTYWEGRGFAVNPVATAGRWQHMNSGLAPEVLAEALLPYGVEHTWRGHRFLLWEYYDVPDHPGRIRPGASGMAQGRVAQLMARAYHRTGDPRFAGAAVAAIAAFRVPVNGGGVVSVVSASGAPKVPWYVERAYPHANPWKGAALNGFMVTLLNLKAASKLLAAPPKVPPAVPSTAPSVAVTLPRAPGAQAAGGLAERLAQQGEKSLRRYLPLHDTGSWSLYGLLTPGSRWRTHRASVGYHCYHVRLLRMLAAQAPAYGFAAWARRWNRDALRRGVHCERLVKIPEPGQLKG